MEIDDITDEEARLFSTFVVGMKSLSRNSSDPITVRTACQITRVCMKQMLTQRKTLQNIQSKLDLFARETGVLVRKETEQVDRNVEYMEAQISTHPELMSEPSHDLKFRKMQLCRENEKMCIAAEAYLECARTSGRKPTLGALISLLEGKIPMSMIRKSYNLTKISGFIRENKELFPSDALF